MTGSSVLDACKLGSCRQTYRVRLCSHSHWLRHRMTAILQLADKAIDPYYLQSIVQCMHAAQAS